VDTRLSADGHPAVTPGLGHVIRRMSQARPQRHPQPVCAVCAVRPKSV